MASESYRQKYLKASFTDARKCTVYISCFQYCMHVLPAKMTKRKGRANYNDEYKHFRTKHVYLSRSHLTVDESL
jgi:hypothetical protein